MQTDLRGRDLIGDLDFSKEEVETILDVAWDLKRKRALGEPHAYLRDKVLAMLFFFSSTRTRGSFEAGMAQLGGHAAFVESRTTQISHGDTEKELGDIFGRYFDGIAIRHVDWGIGNRYLNLVAEASRVPVLNMQCEIYHPHQCLADLMTIMEKKGRNLKKKKMVVSWAYASSYLKPVSVPQSLILQMPRFGMDVVLAHPPEFKLKPEIVAQGTDVVATYLDQGARLLGEELGIIKVMMESENVPASAKVGAVAAAGRNFHASRFCCRTMTRTGSFPAPSWALPDRVRARNFSNSWKSAMRKPG